MAVETSAGNTEEDINFEVKEGECVPNLRGANPVGRDGGGPSYAARAGGDKGGVESVRLGRSGVDTSGE